MAKQPLPLSVESSSKARRDLDTRRARDAAEPVSIQRRSFLQILSGGALTMTLVTPGRVSAMYGSEGPPPEAMEGVLITDVLPGEDVFQYMDRLEGGFNLALYCGVIGAANEFKEGDQLVGLAAEDDRSRRHARTLLSNTRLEDLRTHSLFSDALYDLISEVDRETSARTSDWTVGDLKDVLLRASEERIKGVRAGLTSDEISCVVKVMSNAELIAVASKIFDPLPGSRIGAKGYMGARVQPNSPTDNHDDIRWQVFDAWAYGVGDVLLGTNPVSSEIESVTGVELALQDIIETFGLQDVLPHCVLGHIDVQAEAEARTPGSTALWFQSLGGTEAANGTFDVSIEGMRAYASQRAGRYGLYFETGQGADATNGHASGIDMVVHESRKYGFARVLQRDVANAQNLAGRVAQPWVHLNDVAGFIGPEVFRSREQLVRCCLEDIVMGKLHGLTIGLDICSTLHMEVDLDDLDWCIDQIMPANPAYLMALPTKNDPMLSYLTTGYHDHVRIRERFGYRVNDAMWAFFQSLDVVEADGRPGPNFGKPNEVFLRYRRAKGDERPDAEILTEGARTMAEVRARGVWIAEGHGTQIWDMEPDLADEIDTLYADAKVSIWSELETAFVTAVPRSLWLRTRSENRDNYIGDPTSGEHLADRAVDTVERLRSDYGNRYDVQIVVSDGLNARAISDEGHVLPYLEKLDADLRAAGFRVAPQTLVLQHGRVRAGYQVGELLYGRGASGHRAIIHVIGERPGSGHHNFSVYLTAPEAGVWATEGRVDHDITKVVSGISDTALNPQRAAADTVRLLGQLWSSDNRG